MPRLARELAGAEPVDQRGAAIGPPVTLHVKTEFVVTIQKLKRPSDSFDDLWCEIRVGDQLYRVPLKLLEFAKGTSGPDLAR
jgi:hypothetical protein